MLSHLSGEAWDSVSQHKCALPRGWPPGPGLPWISCELLVSCPSCLNFISSIVQQVELTSGKDYAKSMTSSSLCPGTCPLKVGVAIGNALASQISPNTIWVFWGEKCLRTGIEFCKFPFPRKAIMEAEVIWRRICVGQPRKHSLRLHKPGSLPRPTNDFTCTRNKHLLS